MLGIRSGMMRHAVTVFAATATLLVHVGEDIGHETVVYEVSCSMGHVGVGGLRAVRPMKSSAGKDFSVRDFPSLPEAKPVPATGSSEDAEATTFDPWGASFSSTALILNATLLNGGIDIFRTAEVLPPRAIGRGIPLFVQRPKFEAAPATTVVTRTPPNNNIVNNISDGGQEVPPLPTAAGNLITQGLEKQGEVTKVFIDAQTDNGMPITRGSDVFFIGLFQINTNGAREWASNNGVVVCTPRVKGEMCPVQLPLPPEPFPFQSDIAGNRTDVFEVRACPAGGAGTAFPFLEDEDVQQSEHYVGSYLARGSITYEGNSSNRVNTNHGGHHVGVVIGLVSPPEGSPTEAPNSDYSRAMVPYDGAETSAILCPLIMDSTNVIALLPALQGVRLRGCFVAPATCGGSFHHSCVFYLVCPVDGKPIGGGVFGILSAM